MTDKMIFDVIIVGGSYAGLSAAMALGRSLRNVLIIDSGQPCNIQTPHSHNFLTQDGIEPKAIAEQAKNQVLKYDTLKFINGRAIKGNIVDDLFSIEIDTGAVFISKKLLFTTGVKDILPEISGLAECWGISVLHCPYCHGYEVKNTKIGLLGNGELGFELSRLISNWTKDLVLFTNGESTLTEDQKKKVLSNHIRIVEKEINHIEHSNGNIKKLVFKNGEHEALNALFTRGTFKQHCEIPITLGCELTEQGYIKVDEFQKTSIKGIYAAGDNAIMYRAVSAAISAGNKAGVFINKELIDETF